MAVSSRGPVEGTPRNGPRRRRIGYALLGLIALCAVSTATLTLSKVSAEDVASAEAGGELGFDVAEGDARMSEARVPDVRAKATASLTEGLILLAAIYLALLLYVYGTVSRLPVDRSRRPS